MEVVDKIWLLSEQGHNQLVNGNFSVARTYFINAATLALEQGNDLPEINQLEYQSVAKSLLAMAKNAHNLTFKQIEEGYFKKELVKSLPSFGSRPAELMLPDPSKEEIGNESNSVSFPIGRLVKSKKLVKWEPEELMNGITLITGGSGSGKSEFLKSMAEELIHNNIPVVILDLHGDLDIRIETISLDYRGLNSVNPMELTSYSEIDGGPTPHINRMMNQFDYAIRDRFSSTQKSWLRNLLQFSYEQHGIFQNRPEDWHRSAPDFSYLLNVIKYPTEKILASKDIQYIRLLETITTSTQMAVENRLTPILDHPAFSGGKGIPIESLTKKPLRIMLKPLNTIDMQFLAADTIIRQIFAYLKSIGHIKTKDQSRFRTFIIIDEVKILTGFRGKLNDPYHILNRLATEARKFGLGLILASQIYSHFGRDIRSNAATKLILRTMDLDETKRCAKEFKLKLDQLREISKPGEGYLSTSKDPDALHIQLYPSKKHPFKK